jgi:hypothetical protein
VARRKVSPKTLRSVLMRLADMADQDKATAKSICDELNAFLDDLARDDFFGTERQLDPRGDQRD